MKFLIFELKTVCYNSYIYFAESLIKQLEDHGHEVSIFRLSEEPLDNMEKYMNKNFDAIIDFNSDLPKAIMDDDSFFLNHIDAPFYDVILDHPLYHHDTLKNKINNFNVICLDNNHLEYIKKYYPHVKSVFRIQLTGEKSLTLSDNYWEIWNERPYDICFTGSYTAPEKFEKIIVNLPSFMRNTISNMIDMMLSNPLLTIEAALTELSLKEGHDYVTSDFPLHSQFFYLADAYVRSLNRKLVIKSLDKTNYSFHIFGGLWEELDLRNAKVHQELPFSLTFAAQSRSKISLNVMPNFKEGSHDRIFSSQLNGAVSLTDSSISLLKEYEDKRNILFYSCNNLIEMNQNIDYYLSNIDELKKIAQNGENIASSNHSWTNIYEVFIKEISNN